MEKTSLVDTMHNVYEQGLTDIFLEVSNTALQCINKVSFCRWDIFGKQKTNKIEYWGKRNVSKIKKKWVYF